MLPGCLQGSRRTLGIQAPAEAQSWGPQRPFRKYASRSNSVRLWTFMTPHPCTYFSPQQRQARQADFCPLHKRGN